MNWGGIYHFPRRRGREDRIPCRDTDEGPEVGSDEKKKVKQKQQAKRRGVMHMKWITEWRKKEGEKKKRSCDGDRPAARSDPLLLWPNPPHRLGVRVWAFLCSAVFQLFVTVSDLMCCWINHPEELWVLCTVHMCLREKPCLRMWINEHVHEVFLLTGGRAVLSNLF